MKLDAPLYTEDELDALERENPREALRIAREQAMLKKQLEQTPPADAVMPNESQLDESLREVRKILLRDGGDLDFVRLEGDAVVVRLKGACAGCPRAALDLKGVVEALLRRRFPAIREVRNLY
ncbi:MAG: NifU family protein [Burkholderiales bacterium]